MKHQFCMALLKKNIQGCTVCVVMHSGINFNLNLISGNDGKLLLKVQPFISWVIVVSNKTTLITLLQSVLHGV